MDWTTWINTAVGVIGIVIGAIGFKNISDAKQMIKNRNINADTVQQAQVIKNGLDDYAVIRLSKDTTREELERILKEASLARMKVKPTENGENIITFF